MRLNFRRRGVTIGIGMSTLVGLFVTGAACHSAEIDLKDAVVFAPAGASLPEQTAVRMLVEEVAKRTGIGWKTVHDWPANQTVIALGTRESLKSPPDPALLGAADETIADGYRLTSTGGAPATVAAVGHDPSGAVFAAGRLLRELRMSTGKVSLADGLKIVTSPKYPLRGHQLGYRPKTNSYDAWDVATWEQYIRDLAVFGTNAVELLPPRTDDDATSPHFPLPQLEMMVEMSRICDQYGMDVWIWYPALDKDYGDPATVEAALKEWEVVYKALPRIDAIFVPGGDPGHTHPMHMLPFLEKQTASLQQHHPHAQMWMSPQGFDAEWMQFFLDAVQKDQPRWLAGVVYGPQVRLSLPELRARVPKQYPIRWYPDITHCRQCEYPVMFWDTAFAITEGREGVNPRPNAQAHILRTMMEHTNGFISYSEGCNDDVNKFVWSALSWDPGTPVIDVLRQYSRYFIGAEYEDTFAQGLLALELAWDGPLLSNHAVDTTLLAFQTLERNASPETMKNWRFQQGLYRAYYDSFIRDRLIYETDLEQQARDRLASAPQTGSLAAIRAAEEILNRATAAPVAQEKRQRVFQIGDLLFESIRMQLSVERHQAIAAERGANLDTIDLPLNNRVWLGGKFAEIQKQADEDERLRAIHELVDWTNPGPGGFYDDLGNPALQPHLLLEGGFAGDPESFHSPRGGCVIGEPYFSMYPRSWLNNAEALYDGAIRMRYEDLDPAAQYRIKVSYAGDSSTAMMRLVADDSLEVHPEILKGRRAELLEFDIPAEATRDGVLDLTWRCNPGRGGNGRGCQVAEVWLMRKPVEK